MLPMTKKVFNYAMNWEVVKKYELHEKMRPWISNIERRSTDGDAAGVVSDILEIMKSHGSAVSIRDKILYFRLVDEVESRKLFRNMWAKLFFEIKRLEEVDGKKPLGIEDFNETPKTEEELLLLEINWAVFDQYELHEKIRPWITKKVMALLETERASAVDQVVDCIRKKNLPSQMLEVLELSFDVRTEAVVRIIWRTLLILEELHRQLRPWIFREIMEFVRPEEAATSVVDSIVSGIKAHANAKEILELVKPSLGEESSVFVLNLWMKLIFGIQLAGTTGLDLFPDIDRERFERETVKFSQYGDRFSRNRHFMTVAFDYENLCKLKQVSETMPKTKAELFSYEIQWDVYEKHGLRRHMRAGMWIETLELIRKKQKAMPVDEQIMWSIFDYHVSASRREFAAQQEAIMVFEEIMSRLYKDCASPSEMLEYLGPVLGSGFERFVMRMWYALISGVKLAEAGVEKKCKLGWGSMVLLPPVENEDF
ncbi:hypothetical protein MKX03_019965 [Papaver bracteatum]|nr:hypothetical protein MKX03_019965 [Papaver bracteatum]